MDSKSSRKRFLATNGKEQQNQASHVIYKTFMNNLQRLNKHKRLITTKALENGLNRVLGAISN